MRAWVPTFVLYWAWFPVWADPFAAEKRKVELAVREGRGTIYFTHIHKGGGTTICSLAKVNNMRVPPEETSAAWTGKNCNPRREDFNRALYSLPSTQAAYASELRVTFYANEWRLPAALSFGTFAFLGVMRDPLHLVMSNMGNNVAKYASYGNRQLSIYIGCAASVRHALAGGAPKPAHYALGDEYTRAVGEEPVVDGADARRRLLPRRSAGQRGRAAKAPSTAHINCDHRTAADLTRQDLEAAKRRLQRFSLVVPTERIRDAMPLFADKFGWTAPYVRAGTRKESEGKRIDPYKSSIDKLKANAQLYAQYLRSTTLDHELYAYGVELFEAELAALAGTNRTTMPKT